MEDIVHRFGRDQRLSAKAGRQMIAVTKLIKVINGRLAAGAVSTSRIAPVHFTDTEAFYNELSRFKDKQ